MYYLLKKNLMIFNVFLRFPFKEAHAAPKTGNAVSSSPLTLTPVCSNRASCLTQGNSFSRKVHIQWLITGGGYILVTESYVRQL